MQLVYDRGSQHKIMSRNPWETGQGDSTICSTICYICLHTSNYRHLVKVYVTYVFVCIYVCMCPYPLELESPVFVCVYVYMSPYPCEHPGLRAGI